MRINTISDYLSFFLRRCGCLIAWVALHDSQSRLGIVTGFRNSRPTLASTNEVVSLVVSMGSWFVSLDKSLDF